MCIINQNQPITYNNLISIINYNLVSIFQFHTVNVFLKIPQTYPVNIHRSMKSIEWMYRHKLQFTIHSPSFDTLMQSMHFEKQAKHSFHSSFFTKMRLYPKISWYTLIIWKISLCTCALFSSVHVPNVNVISLSILEKQ